MSFGAHIGMDQAQAIVNRFYGLEGQLKQLPGEEDMNFRLDSHSGTYLLKISRPGTNPDVLDFQTALLGHLAGFSGKLVVPELQGGKNGDVLQEYRGADGKVYPVRLLTWIEGRLWANVNPRGESLLQSLGEKTGTLTLALQGFTHPEASRSFIWDLARAEWTYACRDLFDPAEWMVLSTFQARYREMAPRYQKLRKGVVHNDANDNNIVVGTDLESPEVVGLIDYGDAVYTQLINDVAICIAYAAMDSPDPLEAAVHILKGYHKAFPLQEDELDMLYTLVGMRAVVSVCRSAQNRKAEPENAYLQVSDAGMWSLLRTWAKIPPILALCRFRTACNYAAHRHVSHFSSWAAQQRCNAPDLFPGLSFEGLHHLDLSVGADWTGHIGNLNDPNELEGRIALVQKDAASFLLGGGYGEARALYSSEAYEKAGINGPKSRSIHLGIDFWVAAGTAVHTLFDSEVVFAVNDAGDKEYGGLVVLKHAMGQESFYSLYGHLDPRSIAMLRKGDQLIKGEMIGLIGNWPENGNWAPHLHFQLMLDLLDYTDDFPGVCFADEQESWLDLCPDPNLLFKEEALKQQTGQPGLNETKDYRKKHLGKSLSLSYHKPLKIVRGDGPWLIDHLGRRFLDTVNNVAHVGHEHPRVVAAGQAQMAILNTNTRYLHDNIIAFAESLLESFPPELSVVHFVNSGSEANELALRMAMTASGQKDMIAMEMGYHGNTTGCVSISSYKFDGRGGTGAAEHTHVLPLPDRFRGRYRGSNTGPLYAAHINPIIEELGQKGRKPAAFICESILSCAGQIELPEGFLKLAYEAVRKTGGLCIADEVQVGCGRLGSHFWGFQLHEVIPDIVTIGKPIGNGHPLAAVVCTPKVADAFANGMEYFNTFGGNPVSCAIGTAVLQVIRDEQLQENALSTGNFLKSGLRDLQQRFPIIADVRGQGLFLGFELNGSNLQPLGDRASYLAERMKASGILMSTEGRDENVLKIKPPLVFSENHACRLLEMLDKVLREDFMQI